MALIKRNLYIDVDGGMLVESETSTAEATLPAFVQGDTVALSIYLLRRSDSYPVAIGGLSPFSKINPSGLALRVGIGTPTSAVGSGSPIVYQNSWSIDSNEKCFNGTLYFTPSACATALGSSTSVQLTLEVEVAESGAYSTVLQTNITLRAELIESTAPEVAQPEDEFYTKAQCNALFMPRTGEAGSQLVLKSPSGTKTCYIWLDDGGELHQDIV